MDYIVIKSKKRKNTIEFRVINNKVYVYTPLKVKDDYIHNLYLRYKEELLNKIKNTSKIKYLGKEYNLVNKNSKLLVKPSIEIIENDFIIYLPENKIVNIDSFLIEWKKIEIKKIIEERIKYFLNNYKIFKFSFDKNKISYKNQRSLWGSCSSVNNLNFNCNLIEKRIEVIDYVIIHELSHTLYKDHSKNFWNCIANIIPNYKELRKELKNN